MRLENGKGSITRLSGNRRNPYVIRITTGYEIDQKSGRKKQTRKTIGYAPTKREGKKLLLDYIKVNLIPILHLRNFLKNFLNQSS